MSAAKAKKKKKEPFTERMKRRGREAVHLGRTLKDEPKALPGESLRLMKRTVRTIWDARGGGLYACGFVVTFVFLEIRMLLQDIREATGVGDFFIEQGFEIVFRYIGESFVNSIYAFMWPVFVIQIRPPWGIALLVGMYVVFANFVKAPLERWLFDDDDTEAQHAAGD